MAPKSYEIRQGRADEQSELVKFLEQYYFPRETINRLYLKRNENRIDEMEKKNIEDDVRKTYTIIVENVPSLVAVDKESNEIVGLTLLMIEGNPNSSNITLSNENSDVKLSPVTEMPIPLQSKLLNEIATHVVIPAYNSVDLFAEIMPLQRTALKLTFVSVNPEHCGRGLATKLVEEAVKYAENKGIGFVYALCSSPFSRKATEKNGFKKYSDVDLLNCRDNDGNAIFDGEESYVISMMAKQTSSSRL